MRKKVHFIYRTIRKYVLASSSAPHPVSARDRRRLQRQRGRERMHSNFAHSLMEDAEGEWAPPEPSRASRPIALRNTASYRGSIVDPSRHREFQFESKLERDFLYITLTSKDVADVHEQPGKVWFVGPDGKWTYHVFDVLVVLKSGKRVAIDIKPRSKVQKSGIETTQRLIKEQIGKAFADVFLVRTEDHVHPDDVFDARFLMRARRLADPRADTILTKLLRRMHGWCRLGDLVKAARIGGATFNAVVRMIGDGLLEVYGNVRISLDAFVRRARPCPEAKLGEEN